MKKQIILGGLLVLLASACSAPNKTDNPNTIDIAGSFEQLTELKVSQLGRHIRYVPLETTDSSLIGNSYSIRLLKDRILVTSGNHCLAFDRQTGKYIGNIGHKGDDPEGYSEAMFYIHPQTGTLYFHRQPDKLVKYTPNGEFQGEAVLPQEITQSFYATFSDSLIIGHYEGPITFSSSGNRLIYSDEKGEKRDSVNPFIRNSPIISSTEIASIGIFKGKSGKKILGMLGYNGVFYLECKNGKKHCIPINYPTLWHCGNDLHFRETFADTIYTIKGNTATPYLTFNTGKWTLPPEKTGEKDGTEEYITVSYIMETPQHILFECIQGIYSRNTLFTGIYNKADGTTRMNKAKTGFTDDLSQFMPFFPETSSEQGEYASLIETGEIEQWLDEHPETIKGGKLSFLQTIDEDSNPVCVIVEP